uniref:hypothetical protein n=1 Tax=Aeromonas rivipollensis TaxID=948519 RepID=UPI003D252461
MKKEEVLGILQDNGFVLDEEKSLPYGVQFSFRNGAKVNVFDKGTVTPQGQHIDLVKALLGVAAPNGGAVPVGATVATRKKVFVVYGHDVANSTSKCDTRLCRLTVLFEYLDRLP